MESKTCQNIKMKVDYTNGSVVTSGQINEILHKNIENLSSHWTLQSHAATLFLQYVTLSSHTALLFSAHIFLDGRSIHSTFRFFFNMKSANCTMSKYLTRKISVSPIFFPKLSQNPTIRDNILQKNCVGGRLKITSTL